MKSALREHYRARRREFSAGPAGPGARTALNSNLRRLLGDLNPGGRAHVCAYLALPEEAAVDAAPDWYLPVLDGDDLSFRRPHHPDALETNRFGIAEPRVGDSTPWNEDAPTLVVCPAVAVDWRGGRLGMGKSFYDRFFKDHPACVRIGVAFAVQVATDPLPAEEWDQPLDWIITEQMILRTFKRSSPPWT